MMTRISLPSRGLYAITPAGTTGQALVTMVEQALVGGTVLVQYRAKPRLDADTARALLARCRARGVPLVINDDVELPAAIGADGVHLGRDDAGIVAARKILGPNTLIGASCYNDLERAERAANAGADYLAFGSIYPSPTKPHAAHCPLDIIARARRRFNLPIAAIGGITTDNAPAVIAAGASWLAVISDVFSAPDITARARQYQALFS